MPQMTSPASSAAMGTRSQVVGMDRVADRRGRGVAAGHVAEGDRRPTAAGADPMTSPQASFGASARAWAVMASAIARGRTTWAGPGWLTRGRPRSTERDRPARRTDGTASGVPASRAARAASEQTGQAGSRRSAQLRELGLERIEQQQPAGERPPDPEQDLEDLVGLEQAHDPGHHAQDAGHGAAGRELRRRRGRVEAAVAGPLVRDERGQLALEPEDGGVDHRDPGRDRRVVEEVARLERVGAVQDHVVAGDDPLDVVRRPASPRGRPP